MTKSHPSAKIPSLAVRGILIDHVKADMDTHYVCLPMPTLKAARARMRFENMTQEERVEVLAKAIRAEQAPQFAAKVSWAKCADKAPYLTLARAVLRVIEGEAT